MLLADLSVYHSLIFKKAEHIIKLPFMIVLLPLGTFALAFNRSNCGEMLEMKLWTKACRILAAVPSATSAMIFAISVRDSWSSS